MEKEITLDVNLSDNNTVTVNRTTTTSSEQTLKEGTITFIATLDGRKKTFNPEEALLKAGLVTSDDLNNFFPTLKATDEFMKLFEFKTYLLSYSDNNKVKSLFNEALKELGLTIQDVVSKLQDQNITTTATLYGKTKQDIKELLNN